MEIPFDRRFLGGVLSRYLEYRWDILCGFIKSLWKKEVSITEVIHTKICLIPKITSPQTVNHFRPIALCNSIYKIFSKVIVNRMKQFMDLMITPNQTGFNPKRKIHENIVVAQETLHNMKKVRGKKGYFSIKLDLAKAYDNIS